MKMKKIISVLFILFFSILFGETYVLVTGIGDFKDKNIIPLPGAIKDAQVFKDTLLSLSIVDKENLLYYENPTLSELKKAIISWAKMAKSENDLLIFYYSGHGYSKDGKTYLIPSDAYSDVLSETALDFTGFLSKIKPLMKTKKVLIILDSCYSGSLIKDRPVKFKTYEKKTLKDLSDSVVFLLSSKEGEVSQEKREGGGWFTHYLIEGIRGKANSNGDDLITIEELYEYVSENVEKVTNGMQHPIMFASSNMEDIPISYDFSMLEMKALKELKDRGAPEDVLKVTSKVVFQDSIEDNELDRKVRNYIHSFALGKIDYDMYIDLIKGLKLSTSPAKIIPKVAPKNTFQNPPAKSNEIVPAKGSKKFFTVGVDLGTFLILPFADVYVRLGNVEVGIGGMLYPSEESFLPLIKVGLSTNLWRMAFKIGVYYGEYEEATYDYYYGYSSETTPLPLIYALVSLGSPNFFLGTSDLIIPTFLWNVEF